MSVKQRLLLVIAVLATCILLDQVTKQFASQTLSPLTSTLYLNGVLRFIYAENSGIMFSVGAGLPGSLQFLLFTLIPLLLLLFLLGYVLVRGGSSPLTLISCAMIVGGGLSNIFDRLINDGAVIDFIYLDLWDRSTGIFNIADVAITIGIAALFIQSLVSHLKHNHG